MFKNLGKDLRETFCRRHFYLYDFFDGTHVASWSLAYLFHNPRKNWIKDYETAIARFAGVPDAVAFGAGRMAFYAILEALGIGRGDEVILPGYTCAVVPNAVLYRGAKPVYVDIEKTSFNIDVSRIEKAITSRTKAILAQHTFGRPCEIEEILRIARIHGLKVIEDCAHAFGATYQGRPLGTFGDAAFVSTDHTKVLSTSTGGFAFTASPELSQRIRKAQERAFSLPWHARLRIFLQYPLLTLLSHPRLFWFGRHIINYTWRFKIWFYFQDEMDTQKPSSYPTRLSHFQAFIGWKEMQRLQENIRHRRDMAIAYQESLLDRTDPLGDGAYLRFSLLVASPSDWEEALGRYFTVGRWFDSVTHGRCENLAAVGYQPGSCPTAEYAAAHIINFPTHFRVNETAQKRFRSLLTAGLKQSIQNGSRRSE